MGRLSNVIDEVLTEEKLLTVRVPNSAKEIQFVFDRTKFELPSDKDEPGAELFRCELNYGTEVFDTVLKVTDREVTRAGMSDGWFGGGCNDARIEKSRTPRPGQRMLWTFFSWFVPDKVSSPARQTSDFKEVPVRVRPFRPFHCLMHIEFFPDTGRSDKQLEASELL